MKNSLYFAVLAIILFTAALTAKSKADNKKVNKEIAEVNKNFADSFSSGDAEGMISCYTKDATFLPPNSESYTGTESIKNVFSSLLSQGKVNFSSKTLSLIIRKDIAVEEGSYTLDFTPTGKDTQHGSGKYILVWKHLKNGSWRIYYDMYNSNK